MGHFSVLSKIESFLLRYEKGLWFFWIIYILLKMVYDLAYNRPLEGTLLAQISLFLKPFTFWVTLILPSIVFITAISVKQRLLFWSIVLADGIFTIFNGLHIF
jgi:hypothetical protein